MLNIVNMYPMKRKITDNDRSSKTVAPFTYHEEHHVYRSGSREVNFSCQVCNKSIEYLKKCILDIINENQSLLEKRKKSDDDNDDSDDSDSDSDSESVKKKTKDDETKPFVIKYIINTYGGCLNSTYGFVGFVNAQRKKYKNIKFESVIIGASCSAGTILAIIADNRKMDRFAIGMIHELQTGSSSTYTHLVSFGKHVQISHDLIIELYIENSGRDINNKAHVKEIDDMLRLETWMTADEYLKAGFIDEIIGTEVWVSRPKRKSASKVTFPGYKYKSKNS